MGATLASIPTAVWAHLLSGESSSGGGGLEHTQQQQLLQQHHHQLQSLSSPDAFRQCGNGSNPPPLSHQHWEAHEMDYSSPHHYMMGPAPLSNALLSPPGPNLLGQQQHWTNGPVEHLQSSSLLLQQHHQQQHNQQQHQQQLQQHCSDYQEPFDAHIMPNLHVNLLHESPEDGREVKRSAAAPNQGNGGEEMSSSSGWHKRPRLEQAAACLPFKGQVRKEKLGERVTALQQLVSPFGKTDTASVLQEAIGYIKFLQDQVQVLSTPYMKPTLNSGSISHHDHSQELGSIPNWPSSKSKNSDDLRQDLRSRGLCLVPVSCTLQVANDNGADFWTPAIGGGCR